MKYNFITVEGNIGAGKTTLSTLLAQRLNKKLVLEEFADNPFLPKFYENPTQYAFPLELFFMAERYKQLKEILAYSDLFLQGVVSDYLFTKCLLFAKATLKEEEYALYKRLFDIIHQQILLPDILIYLHAPVDVLQKNIKKRQRSFEQQIPNEYLQKIQDMYMGYIEQHNHKVLMVDASNANFLENECHLQIILDALDKDYTPGKHFIALP